MNERPVARVINIPGVESQVSEPPTTETANYLNIVSPETKFHAVSHTMFHLHGADDPTPDRFSNPFFVGTSLLAQTVHNCFDKHHPLSLAPEVIWHTVATAVAETVKRDPETYRHLFTYEAEGTAIVKVRDDSLQYGSAENDWARCIGLFREALGEHVPSGTLEKMLPQFSTTTPVSEAATLTAFMEAASPFYDYKVYTMCGIPAVRLEGTPADWKKVLTTSAALSEVMPALKGYWDNLLPVLTNLTLAADGKVDLDFWRSMYKINSQSGSENVNGWFVNLFAYIHDPSDGSLRLKTEEEFDHRNLVAGWGEGPEIKRSSFPSQVSAAPFVWEYMGLREIPMQFLGGVLGVEYDEGFLSPQMGYAVVEIPE